MLESPLIVLPSLVWVSLMYFGGSGGILQKIFGKKDCLDRRILRL